MTDKKPPKNGPDYPGDSRPSRSKPVVLPNKKRAKRGDGGKGKKQLATIARHSLFVAEYMKDLKPAAAVIRAGYSAANPYATAHNLMKDPEISKMIAEAMERRNDECRVDANYVLQKLKIIAEANIADFVELVEEEEEVFDWDAPVNKETGLQPTKRVKVQNLKWKPFASIKPQEKLEAIKGIKNGRGGIELTLHDKTWSLDMLSKHIGLYEADNRQRAEAERLNSEKVAIYLPDNGRDKIEGAPDEIVIPIAVTSQ